MPEGAPRRDGSALQLQRIIFLDEPTTGLDPVTKRAVWRTIERAKANKTIVLTTHSMEEADALSDYIGIVAAGQMRAIGTRQRLKQRFGTGYRLQVVHSAENARQVDQLCLTAAPYARLDRREALPHSHQVRSFYIVPPQNPIQFVYESCCRAKGEGVIEQFEIDFTNLEEVFLTIAQMVEPPSDVERNILSM